MMEEGKRLLSGNRVLTGVGRSQDLLHSYTALKSIYILLLKNLKLQFWVFMLTVHYSNCIETSHSIPLICIFLCLFLEESVKQIHCESKMWITIFRYSTHFCLCNPTLTSTYFSWNLQKKMNKLSKNCGKENLCVWSTVYESVFVMKPLTQHLPAGGTQSRAGDNSVSVAAAEALWWSTRPSSRKVKARSPFL